MHEQFADDDFIQPRRKHSPGDNAHSFMDLGAHRQHAANGKVVQGVAGGHKHLFGEFGRHAPIAAEDQARVIVGILENPSPHRGQVYPLYGPVEFTYAEIAQVLSRVLGWEVRYKQVSIETMLTMMASGGQQPPPGHNARALYGEFEPRPERQGDSFAMQHLREVAIDHQNGIFAGTNELIEKIGGHPPMTLEEFINKHRAAFTA